MAKILATSSQGIEFAAGANYYRFIGIEFTRQIGTGPVSHLVDLNTATNIIFDQTWFQGDDDSSGDETKRGINLGESYLVGVVDSYFNDFYCISGWDPAPMRKPFSVVSAHPGAIGAVTKLSQLLRSVHRKHLVRRRWGNIRPG